MKKTIIVCLTCFVIGAAGITTFAEAASNNPPNIPIDPHPIDGAIDIGIKTHLSWTGGDPDPGDKAVYDLYFGTLSEPELLETNLQMPNYYPGILENNTQYYWKVVARDESQAETSGPIWTFTTNDCDCDPPEKPDGQNKTRNRNRYEYTTRIMNIHQNHNGLYYQFSWGDGNCSEWMGPYNNSEKVRAEHQWEESGSYQVQARARFQNNPPNICSMDDWVYTGWSEPLIVTVENTENNAPSKPIIIGTQNGKVGESYDYTFSAVDPESDDLYIYVEFCEGCADSKWHGPLSSGEELTISHSWEERGEFTIRAQAKDSSDAISEWNTLTVSMPRSYISDSPILSGNGLMQRLMNQIRDTLGICQGGVNLETLTGILTYDGTNFFIGTVELHFGPTWYITSAMSIIDYDKDGKFELIIDELKGLVGTEITVEGHYQSDNWISIFTINNDIYRELGSPIWSSQHEYRWSYGHRKGQP
jgi:hypothetical protein